MKGGINASIVDQEYRRRKMYKKKSREVCKDRDCTRCKYQNICLESEFNVEE